MLPPIQQKYAHGQGRKCGSFSDVDNDPVIKINKADLGHLEVHAASEIGVETPFDDLSSNMPQVFILLHGGQNYLVNTEGFSYCRYIARCKVV